MRDAERGWRIAAVQKTQHKPLMEAVSFMFQPTTRPGRATVPGGSGK